MRLRFGSRPACSGRQLARARGGVAGRSLGGLWGRFLAFSRYVEGYGLVGRYLLRGGVRSGL